MADARRLTEVGMVPVLAKELAAQITAGVGNFTRLAELSMVPRLAKEVAAQIATPSSASVARLAEMGMVPGLANEVVAQIKGGGGVTPPDPGPFPTFAPAFFRIAADNPANTIETTDQTFAPSDVILADNRIALPNLNYAAPGSLTSPVGTRVYFAGTDLPPPLVAGQPYYLSPHGSGGYVVYPETTVANAANLKHALSDETPMPVQNMQEGKNAIVFTGQGSGTHRVYSNPLVSVLPDLMGTSSFLSDVSSNRHARYEIETVGGKKALRSRILGRDNTAAGSYNLYGLAMDHGPSGNRVAFQTNMRSKRTVLLMAVLQSDESDTRGLTKAPILPAGVNTTTGLLTYVGTAPGPAFTTAFRVRVKPDVNSGVLPTGLSEGVDYYVRAVTSLTYTLHPTANDATNNTNVIVPTTQGSVGFLIFMPDRPADQERMRFLAEVRKPSDGNNTITVRTNESFYGDTTMVVASDFVITGTNNGRFGNTGRVINGLVPDTATIAKIRLWFPSGSVAPQRADTGLPLASGDYWITRDPSSATFVRLHDSQASATASLGQTNAASSCIKFNGVAGSGYCRAEQTGTRPLSVGTELPLPVAAKLVPNFWSPPIGEKGLLAVVIDYNDPTASFIRHRMYWNGNLVADYENTGAKGLTNASTNAADSGMTLLNSPQRHVSFEGLLFDFMLGASVNEVTASDMAEVTTWFKTKHGIA